MNSSAATIVSVLIMVMAGSAEFSPSNGAVTAIPGGMQLTVTPDGSTLERIQDTKAQDKPCPMSDIEKGYYCRSCDKILEEKDVEGVASGAPYRFCKICSKDGKRAACRIVDLCARTYYECAECKKQSLKSGACHEKEMKKKTHRARISYVCEGCGFKSEGAINCPGKPKDCKNQGQPLKKVCESSGKFPHAE